MTEFSDQAIIGAQAILSTFTEIRGDEFIKATEAVADMSALFGTDLKGSAIQLGKALNDPIIGVSALAEVGDLGVAPDPDDVSCWSSSNSESSPSTRRSML